MIKTVNQRKSLKILAALLLLFFSFLCLYGMIDKAEAATVQYSGTSGTCSWELNDEGVLRIYPTNSTAGKLASYAKNSSWPWSDYEDLILKVVVEDGVSTNTDATYLFYDLRNCVEMDLSKLDVSNTTNFKGMFGWCQNLTSLNISNFNTSNATNMQYMFLECASLTSLDLSSFDTSKVTNMYSMFADCDELTNLTLGANFKTSNVQNMRYMFSKCPKLKTLDLSSFDSTNLGGDGYMFEECSSLKTLVFGTNFKFVGDNDDILLPDGMWVKIKNPDGTDTNDNTQYSTEEMLALTPDTATKLAGTWTKASIQFSGVEGGVSWELNSDGLLRIYPTDGASGKLPTLQGAYEVPWDDYRTSIRKVVIENEVTTSKEANFLFYNLKYCEEIDISGLNTYNLTSLTGLFDGCEKLKNVDVSTIDMSNITSMYGMFSRCYSLTTIDLSDLNTSQVTDMSSMFSSCLNLKTIIFGDNFDTSKVESMKSMFSTCESLESLDLNFFDTSNVKTMYYMFDDCNNLKELKIDNFDTSKVTDMSYMFSNCYNLTKLDVSNFDTSNVESSMVHMFKNCKSLTSLDVSNFKTSKVTSMNSMFSECSKLTTLDVSNFDTSSVENMSCMFAGCSSLLTLDVSNFDTTNVSNMYAMFYNCAALTELDISHFNTNKITTTAGTVNVDGINKKGGMLEGCNSLINLNIESKTITQKDGTSYKSWDTKNITDMYNMFKNCTSLTCLDLSNFNTSSVTTTEGMFNGCSNLTNLDLSNFNTAKVLNMSYMFENCTNLISLDISGFDTSSVYTSGMSYTFEGLSNLKKVVFSNEFVHKAEHCFIGSSVGNNWVKIRNLDGSKTYDNTEYDANSVALLNSTTTPTKGGTWVRYGIEEDYVVNEDGSVEFISIDANWEILSDEIWTYSFNVFDDSLIYHLFEEIMENYTSEAMMPSYITIYDKMATITNTADDIETGTLVITKTVSKIETDEEFEFTLTLTGDDISGKQIFNSVVFNNGIGKFYLGHGEQKTFDLPAGTSFSLEEIAILNYSSVITPATGTISKDESVTVNVVNTYIENPVIEPEKNAVNITIKKTAENLSINNNDFMLFTINGYFTNLKHSETYVMSDNNTFTSDANGNAYCNIPIKAGQEVIIYNIPEGATYQFTEQAGDYISSYIIIDENTEGMGTIVKENGGNVDKNKTLSTEKEVVDKNEEIVITFHNIFDSVQNLTVNKVVKEEQEDGSLVIISDCDDNFEFTINFSNINENDVFTSTIGKVVADENGEASKTFHLKHGQSVNFYDIPDGVRYQIIETENNYLATYTIEGTEVVSSSHENDKSSQSLSTEIEIVNKNENGVITFTNIKENNPEMNVIILKTDNENNPLEGAILQVKDENGEVLEEWTSTTEQHIVALREGTYTLHEKQAPTGYCVAKDIEFTVTKDNENKVIMVDVPLSMMVSSGGNGTIITVIIAVACACIAGVCIYIGKKKSKEDKLE